MASRFISQAWSQVINVAALCPTIKLWTARIYRNPPVYPPSRGSGKTLALAYHRRLRSSVAGARFLLPRGSVSSFGRSPQAIASILFILRWPWRSAQWACFGGPSGLCRRRLREPWAPAPPRKGLWRQPRLWRRRRRERRRRTCSTWCSSFLGGALVTRSPRRPGAMSLTRLPRSTFTRWSTVTSSWLCSLVLLSFISHFISIDVLFRLYNAGRSAWKGVGDSVQGRLVSPLFAPCLAPNLVVARLTMILPAAARTLVAVHTAYWCLEMLYKDRLKTMLYKDIYIINLN